MRRRRSRSRTSTRAWRHSNRRHRTGIRNAEDDPQRTSQAGAWNGMTTVTRRIASVSPSRFSALVRRRNSLTGNSNEVAGSSAF